MDWSTQFPLIAIAGPTGSGKSALALRVCEEFQGEIVNCDSLQIYRGFEAGTAKTPPSDRRGIPHHLIDVLDPCDGYSAGEYARHGRTAIADISARGRLPVVVGGTGFYLRALLGGLPSLPLRDIPLRARLLRREHQRRGSLYRILTRLDPAAASRIHANDTRKLVRALEVRVLTGGSLPPLAEAQALEGYRSLKIGLNPSRSELHCLLDARTHQMFQSGLIEEVRGLLAHGSTGEEKPFAALGYKQVLAFLRGTITLDRAIESAQVETRQYAKRQWTWFRRDVEIRWVSGFGNSPFVIEQCFEMIRAFL